jgi:hypothetical protein
MNTRSTGASKKRKAEANGLDEMDRELYQKFRAAANSVSALYTSSMSLQKRAFNAGSRRTTEKLLEWALTQQENGEGTVNAGDLVSALQAELVVLEGEDACLAAAGDSPGAIGVWEPRASAGRRAGVDAHAVRPPPPPDEIFEPPTDGRLDRSNHDPSLDESDSRFFTPR